MVFADSHLKSFMGLLNCLQLTIYRSVSSYLAVMLFTAVSFKLNCEKSNSNAPERMNSKPNKQMQNANSSCLLEFTAVFCFLVLVSLASAVMAEAQSSFFLILGIHMHNAFQFAFALPSWRACHRTSIL